MPEVVDRDLGDNGNRGGVEGLRDLRACDRGADDDASPGVDDDPRGADRAMADERAAGVAARLDIDVADVEARCLCTLQREANGPDLGIGEDHTRRLRPVRAELDRPAEDRVGGQPALILAHGREQHAAVDVADRIEPVVTGNTEIVVDREWAAGLDPDRLEADARSPMPASECRKHLVRLERRTVVELYCDRARPRHPHHLTLEADVDATFLEAFEHLSAGERLLTLDQPLAAMDEGHLRAEGRPRLRHLDPDDSATEDREARRHLLGSRRLDVRPGAGSAEAFDVGDQRARSGGDDNGLARDELFAVVRAALDNDAAVPVEARAATHERHAVLFEPWQLARVV